MGPYIPCWLVVNEAVRDTWSARTGEERAAPAQSYGGMQRMAKRNGAEAAWCCSLTLDLGLSERSHSILCLSLVECQPWAYRWKYKGETGVRV